METYIRSYIPTDYERVAALYKQSHLYGGQFDENRDAEEKLKKRIEADPDVIWVAESGDEIVGTVSLIEDGRVAWLFRFCVSEGEEQDNVAQELFDHAKSVLNRKGHEQVLVYTPMGNEALNNRYEKLGFTKGGDYTCYWKDI
jgi:predicted N-acetyltransferase YhbS